MDNCRHCEAELILEAEKFFEECQACARETSEEQNADIERES